MLDNVRPLSLDDSVLEAVAGPVSLTDPAYLKCIEAELLSLMGESGGIGLAAPQCGLSLRVFCIGLDMNQAFFNPKILTRSTKVVLRDEGCLSLPGERFIVPRPDWIGAKWHDRAGVLRRGKFHGLMARCFQHEFDHLDGLLINRFPRAPEIERTDVEASV